MRTSISARVPPVAGSGFDCVCLKGSAGKKKFLQLVDSLLLRIEFDFNAFEIPSLRGEGKASVGLETI